MTEPPDCGAAAQAASLTWHRLPDLPPHRPNGRRLRFQGRATYVTVFATDAVLVRTEALEPAGLRATYHHQRKVFVAAEGGPIPNVVEWAFAPETKPEPPCPSPSSSEASTSSSETSG